MGRPPEPGSFSERVFYLEQFRGRTLGIAVPDSDAASHPELSSVLAELQANATRTVLILPASVGSEWFDADVLTAGEGTRFEGSVWRALKVGGRVVVRGEGNIADVALDITKRLGLFKLVRLSELPGVRDARGRRRSFVDLEELDELMATPTGSGPEQAVVLAEIRRLLEVAVPSVNLCRVDALGDELFSYSGSGTLFTRSRYVEVRRFGIEDYDAAADLIARGVAEGYLAPRTDEQIDLLLTDGFGAFIAGQQLAGIGALRVPPGARAGEVASLYTVTRFAGGGVGKHLVAFAIEQARTRGLESVYACTTFDRVGEFFERQGFSRVSTAEIPEEKWVDYDEERKYRLRCFRTWV